MNRFFSCMLKLLAPAVLLCATGCAGVIPLAMSTGASLAVPKTVSLAMTGVKMLHKTTLLAADERNAGDMLKDKIVDIKAQASLLADRLDADVEAHCYNGDIYLVGEVDRPETADRLVRRMKSINGVTEVKGVIKTRPGTGYAPPVNDCLVEAKVEANLIKHYHIRSANFDVDVVQGEAVLLGVVENKAEEQEVVDFVKKLKTLKGLAHMRVTSLLAIQDEYEAGLEDSNSKFALLENPAPQSLCARPETRTLAAKPEARPLAFKTRTWTPPESALQNPADDPSPWQMARLRMNRRIVTMAKAEINHKSRIELLRLSHKILRDKNTSILARLSKTLNNSSQLATKVKLQTLIADISPDAPRKVWNLASLQ
ncbi:MAG: BON domain-containing protein [Desulfovibrionaceae bacterium]|nr:BON domain-containing protein [Desulfovibrionaceae bacterium]